MPLSSGVRLGPYEILDALGVGGMGEVYRARDTRLERTVAIKILPAQFSSDPVRKQRFEREAKIISNLNHPHICVLYDVGHQDGVDYLVMECVEGETLAKRLEKGPLPLDQVLNYGAHIADALDKAHRDGVVHRDLKPGNIILTASGAKLLDFGLAKPATPLASLATLTATKQESPVTERGTIVGTFQYMSPEQIEGKDLDGRSDIFSLGAVLYEMLTGQRAFQGKSQLSVASAIIEKEPTAISSIKPTTPPALGFAIRKSLAKLPDERWQNASDLASQLKWIAEASGQLGAQAPLVSHRMLRERLAWVVVAALATALAVVASGWWRPAHTSTLPAPLIRLSAELSPGAKIDRFRGAWLALSPDGTRIVIAESDASGGARLVMRSLDQGQFAPLFGADRGSKPFFSPDGQWIAFFADGKLRKIPVQGGAPVTLCDAPGISRGASWGDDGNIIAAFNGGEAGLMRVSSSGGVPTSLTQLSKEKGESAHGWPQVLPGSQTVLFTSYYGSTAFDDAEIVAVSLKTGERRTVYKGGFFGRFLPSGHLVFLHQNTTLFAAPFDLRRLALTAAPQPALDDVNSNTYGGGDFDFARNGTVVYVGAKGPSFDYQIAWLDSAGQTKALQATPGHQESPSFSPDGKRLAFELATGPLQADIWVKDLERDTVSRLTHMPGRSAKPVWTPDGRAIVFSARYLEAPGIYWIRADGTGEAQLLMGMGDKRLFPSSFTPDGKRLAYGQNWPRDEIWTVSVGGDPDHPRLGKPEAFLRTSFSETFPAFSPDGHWLAYSSNESGIYELYVRPFPGPGGKLQISTGGGSYPIWSRKERKLFFLTPDWKIMALDYAVNGGSFATGKPQLWSPKSLLYLGGLYPYDLAPDGKRFAVVLDTAAGQEKKPTESVIVLLNFFDELRRKVPVGKN